MLKHLKQTNMSEIIHKHVKIINGQPVTIVDGQKVPQYQEPKQDFQPDSENPEKCLLHEMVDHIINLTDLEVANGKAIMLLIEQVKDLRTEIAALKSKPNVDPSIHTVD